MARPLIPSPGRIASGAVGIIPFYGSDDPELFAIEREAMDRPGLVLAVLDRALPERGLVLDIGAGDGFTAERLSTLARRIVPMEPAEGMRRPGRAGMAWTAGEAERLPFRTGAFAAAYATWAFFFAGAWDSAAGPRRSRPGGAARRAEGPVRHYNTVVGAAGPASTTAGGPNRKSPG